jgi:hypothetical protein
MDLLGTTIFFKCLELKARRENTEKEYSRVLRPHLFVLFFHLNSHTRLEIAIISHGLCSSVVHLFVLIIVSRHNGLQGQIGSHHPVHRPLFLAYLMNQSNECSAFFILIGVFILRFSLHCHNVIECNGIFHVCYVQKSPTVVFAVLVFM